MERFSRLMAITLMSLSFITLGSAGCSPNDASDGHVQLLVPGSVCQAGQVGQQNACPTPVGATCVAASQFCDPANGNRWTECTCTVPTPSPGGDATFGFCTLADGSQGIHWQIGTDPNNGAVLWGPCVPQGTPYVCGVDQRMNQACAVGEGVCQATGVFACSGNAVACTATAGIPQASDTCGNGIDENCDGTDDVCLPCAGEQARIGLPCSQGVGICAAAGVLACDAPTNTVYCTATAGTGSVEVCGNGIDENCDNADASCVACAQDVRITTPPTSCTAGEGLCKGTGSYVCISGSTICNAVAVPSNAQVEICGNGIDENCDGVDDVCPPCGNDSRLGQACRVGTGGCANNGTFTCDVANDQVICSATAGAPTTEACEDGIDQDCNGFDDTCAPCNGDTRLGTSCQVGTGVCVAGGTFQCLNSGTQNESVTCVPAQSPPASRAEICENGLDEDCNGMDLACPSPTCNGDSRIGMGCSVGIGACGSSGTYVCNSGTVVCSAVAGSPGVEGVAQCGNGVDENCDGQDTPCPAACAGNPLIGTACNAGQGVCLTAGVFICGVGNVPVCNAVAGIGSAENCNDNLDNDCDGFINDNCLGLTTWCRDQDLDGHGTSMNTTQSAIQPSGFVALCDDCNDSTSLAYTGHVEICGDGIDNDCQGGEVICSNNCSAAPNANLIGTTCNAGVGECNNLGVNVCANSVVVCNAAAGAPVTETCGNGLDEDCNGSDLVCANPCAGAPNANLLGTACSAGVGACNSAGVYACNAGTVTCNAVAGTPAATESCATAADDNCNGTANEGCGCVGNPLIGTACSAGQGACLAAGTYQCVGNTPTCNAVAGTPAATESCATAADDNCNGTANEGCPPVATHTIRLEFFVPQASYPGSTGYVISNANLVAYTCVNTGSALAAVQADGYARCDIQMPVGQTTMFVGRWSATQGVLHTASAWSDTLGTWDVNSNCGASSQTSGILWRMQNLTTNQSILPAQGFPPTAIMSYVTVGQTSNVPRCGYALTL